MSTKKSGHEFRKLRKEKKKNHRIRSVNMKNWLISSTLSVNVQLKGNENENKNNITEAEKNDQSLLSFNTNPLISPEIPEIQYENMLSYIDINKANISQSTFDLTDPAKWPIITDTVRLHIIENGPKLIDNIDQ